MLTNLSLCTGLVPKLKPKFYYCFLLILILYSCSTIQQQDITALKTDTLELDLYHKFDSTEFKHRGSILIKPRTEYRAATATLSRQTDFETIDSDLLREASRKGERYYLKAELSQKSKKYSERPTVLKSTQTVIKACSVLNSNLTDYITVNLNPLNDFTSVNIYTSDPECLSQEPEELSRVFNTTIVVDSGSIGPMPDTATYIKRLEEDRQNKLKEGKEDNRSFFVKYWMYIVPVVIILMMFSGPEQGAR